MYNIRNVTKDVIWLGADDRRLALFENVFPLPKGGRGDFRKIF